LRRIAQGSPFDLGASGCTLFAGCRTFVAAFHVVLGAFGSAGFADFHADFANLLAIGRASGAKTLAQGADVRTIATKFHAFFVPHFEALGGAFFAFRHAFRASLDAIVVIFHN